MNEYKPESVNMSEVKLDGSITLENISEIYIRFIIAFDESNDIKIIHEKLDEIDISYLQLLQAARKSAINRNKNLTIDKIGLEKIKKLANEIGCEKFMTDFKISEN